MASPHLHHAKTRRAFGAPLGETQAVRQRPAMGGAKTRAAEACAWHCTWRCARRCAWRVAQGHATVQDVSLPKSLTGELVNEATGRH
jgi:alkylation response protein AidB-like acyl-CoA dehydrogenase